VKQYISSPTDNESSSLARWARRGAKHAAAALIPRSFLVVRGPRARRRIALTFDDGPTELTGAYLDVLRRHRARATFFLVGRCCERLPNMADAIAEHGHQIGGHGFTHRAFPEIVGESLRGELAATDALLPKANGHRRCVRPPHGSISVASLVECARAGFTTVLWSWDSGDSRAVSVADILLGFESRPPRNGDILLLHEDQRHTLEALPTLLERLASEGYELCTVDELLRSPAGT
jgi:peptidoglycan/xylan/chitin deacetylase (PgdA/CDA1 family)